MNTFGSDLSVSQSQKITIDRQELKSGVILQVSVLDIFLLGRFQDSLNVPVRRKSQLRLCNYLEDVTDRVSVRRNENLSKIAP